MILFAVYGSEQESARLIQSNRNRFEVVAIVDDSITSDHTAINGVTVLHTTALLQKDLVQHGVIVAKQQRKEAINNLLSIGIARHRIFTFSNETAIPLDPAVDPDGIRNDLKRLQDIHCGQRGFIIGNGPSLKIHDLDRLPNEITFSSNKIYLAFNETKWRPTYYTVCDQLVAANNAPNINSVDSTKLFPVTIKTFQCDIGNGFWYGERFENKFVSELQEKNRQGTDLFFSRDIRFGLHGGYSVIYHQLQLAFFMGIREAYLLGVDFHFSLPGKSAVDERFTSSVYRDALEGTGEINHFHPDYRKPGEKWSMPRLDLQECAFKTAGSVFAAEGGFLKNASRKSALTVLPRADFDQLF
jgi:hypothetical protein